MGEALQTNECQTTGRPPLDASAMRNGVKARSEVAGLSTAVTVVTPAPIPVSQRVLHDPDRARTSSYRNGWGAFPPA
jgi:hypothetical protein